MIYCVEDSQLDRQCCCVCVLVVFVFVFVLLLCLCCSSVSPCDVIGGDTLGEREAGADPSGPEQRLTKSV